MHIYCGQDSCYITVTLLISLILLWKTFIWLKILIIESEINDYLCVHLNILLCFGGHLDHLAYPVTQKVAIKEQYLNIIQSYIYIYLSLMKRRKLKVQKVTFPHDVAFKY